MEEAGAMFHGTHLLISRTKIDTSDAGKRDRTCTHGAGLQRHMEIAAGQALAAELVCCLADHQQFGVRRGVFEFECPVAGNGQYFTIISHQGSSNRYLAPLSGGIGFCQRKAHGVWQFLLHRAR